MLGYHPQVILAGRRINDSIAVFVERQLLRTEKFVWNTQGAV